MALLDHDLLVVRQRTELIELTNVQGPLRALVLASGAAVDTALKQDE